MKDTEIVANRKETDIPKDDPSLEKGESPEKNIDNDSSHIVNCQLSIVNFSLFLLVVAVGLFADLATKQRAFSSLGMPREYRFEENPGLFGIYWVWEDVFGFQTSLNQGALFGMGQGQVFWLAILSGVALIGIGIWLLHSAWKSRFLVVTLGLIVAGILGNLYDRMGLHGLLWNYADEFHGLGEPVYAVRDWILVMIGTYHWPNFNIADSMLVCGAILLVLHSFFAPEEKGTVPANDPAMK